MAIRPVITLLGLGLLVLFSLPAHASEPCCNIVTIAGNLVTAKELATGKTFLLQVTDQALLKSLRVGQKIHADFGTQQVSVDGAQPCCAIVSVTGEAGSAKLPRVKLPTIHGQEPCCNIVANEALKGRLGRIVVGFPSSTVPTGTRIAVFKNGAEVKAGYGNESFELLPGTYEVTMSGKRILNVTVQAGHDTNMKVGVLRITAAKNMRAAVLEGGREIAGAYGGELIGLPAGTFDVQMAGHTEKVTISEWKITDF